MTNLIQFFNKSDINKNVKNTIENIDDLGLKLLDINKIIEPNLIDEYKILNSYKSYLIQHLSIIDTIINKDKYQNYINNLLNTILNSKKSYKFEKIKDILVDNIYKFNYEQYGGTDLDDRKQFFNVTNDGKIENEENTEISYNTFLNSFNNNISVYIQNKAMEHDVIRNEITSKLEELEKLIDSTTISSANNIEQINDLKTKIISLLDNINIYNKYTRDEESKISEILNKTNEKISQFKEKLVNT